MRTRAPHSTQKWNTDRGRGDACPQAVGQVGALIALQRSAGNAAVSWLVAQRCGLRPGEVDLNAEAEVQRRPLSPAPSPLGPRRAAAQEFLRKYRLGPLWDVNGVADGLVAHLNASVKDYPFVRAVITELPSEIEDNVTANLVNRLPIPISVIGLTAEGRALLDVLYSAMITGDVSKFERKQADRIISYRSRVSEAEFVTGMAHRMIFPIRNIGVTRQATATFSADLLPNGKVKVRYTSVRVTQFDMFKADLQTLPGWSRLSDGIELDPTQIVAVHLFDLERHPVIDIPALALIDYSNQIKSKTLDTAATAFFLGLTLGAGGLGGGVISGLRAQVLKGEVSKAYLLGARALIWADRAQFGIQAGAMIINDHRDWIVETFPGAGPGLLDAVDTANRLAGYYGWGRLGVDGLRLIRSKLAPAVDTWRSARGSARLGSKEARVARAVEDEADTLVAELQHAEERAAAQGARGSVTPPVDAKARKVVAGGDKEIHVTRDRIEVCPIQRCPDLKDTVGPAISDPKVAKEVADAEKAARAGDAAGAAARAEAALVEAGATQSSTRIPTSTTEALPSATPRLTGARGHEMLGESIKHLKAAPPGQRIEMFEDFAKQIEKATTGSWSATKSVLPDGTAVFSGSFGHTLVITAQGKVYKGLIQEPGHFTFGKGGVPVPNFANLKELM